MPDLIGQQLGNYRLLQLLGSGGFAEVYLGEHIYLNRYVAVKVLRVHLVQEELAGFLQEAQTLARLDHPHIIRVADFGISGTPFLVMEYLPDGSLRNRHPPGVPVALPMLVSYVKQIADALQYAHEARVIHRDVKPANMLLCRNGQLALGDFGIATVAHRTTSLQMAKVAGSPAYMAPEQVTGKPRPASDQYALAMVVYEWLTGRPAFHGEALSVMYQQAYAPVPSLREQVPTIAPEVEHVVLKALAKAPEERFERVWAFAMALEQASRGNRPPSRRSLEIIAASTHLLPLSSDNKSVTQKSNRDAASAVDTLDLRRVSEQRPSSAPAAPLLAPRARENRLRLLKLVRMTWIEGVLEHSLHQAALIALDLQEQPDALVNPWQLAVQETNLPPYVLPAGTSIVEVYDQAEGELLILGEPGAGKTTLLLELARTLLERASHDEHYPLPVIFTLSAWTSKQQVLTEWFIEELHTKYQVPRQLGASWVETDQILPLLDGLDEVAPAARGACVEAINRYRLQHGLVPTVVCSRRGEYLAQTVQVLLRKAIVVQPLSVQQIEDYLAHAGEPMAALRQAVHDDGDLRALASTPLMLSVLTLAYQGSSSDELAATSSLGSKQEQVFATYVQRMLNHRSTSTRYQPEQILHWLSRLAAQMKWQNQTVFYLEQMQADWLSGSRMLGIYEWWAIRLPSMLMGVLVALAIATWFLGFSNDLVVTCILLGGLFGALLSGESATQRPTTDAGEARHVRWRQNLQRLLIGILISLGSIVNYGLLDGPRVGLSNGLSVGLCSILLQVILVKRNTGQSSYQPLSSTWQMKWQRLLRRTWLRNGLLVGLMVGLSFGLSGWLLDGLSGALFYGLSVGLIGGLSGELLSLLLIGRSRTIPLTDRLIWSWKSLGQSLRSPRHRRMTLLVAALSGLLNGPRFGLSNGLSVGLLNGALNGPRFGLSGWLLNGVSVGLGSGLGYWLLFGLFQGISSETIEDQNRVVPNQGIRRSAFNGLVLGLISAMICVLGSVLISVLSVGLIVGLKNGLSAGLNIGLRSGLSVGLSVGLLTVLLMGGWTCLQHYVLRILLWHGGAIPWNYPHFLDDAAERILLRKVGGGYIFVHRLLLEYFASRDTTLPPQQTREPMEGSEGGDQSSRIILPLMRLPTRKQMKHSEE